MNVTFKEEKKRDQRKSGTERTVHSIKIHTAQYIQVSQQRKLKEKPKKKKRKKKNHTILLM